MSKFQKGMRFRYLNHFDQHLEGEELRLVDTPHNLILQNLPTVEERLAYNVPFIMGKKE